MIDMKDLGAQCKAHRQDINLLQSDVARDTGYSVENISSFETGRNDNARILLWYVAHGLPRDYVRSLFRKKPSYGLKEGDDIDYCR